MCVFGPNNKAQSAAAPPIRLKWTRYNEKGISKRFCIRCAIYGRSIFFYLFYIFTAVCCCLFLFSRINFSAQTRVHMHYSFLKLHGKLCRLIQAASLKHTHTLTQQTITLAQQIFCTAEISKRWKKKNSAHTRFFTNHFHFNESCSHTTIYSRCPPFSISLFLAPRYTEAHLVIMLLHLDYVYVNSRRINEPIQWPYYIWWVLIYSMTLLNQRQEDQSKLLIRFERNLQEEDRERQWDEVHTRKSQQTGGKKIVCS